MYPQTLPPTHNTNTDELSEIYASLAVQRPWVNLHDYLQTLASSQKTLLASHPFFSKPSVLPFDITLSLPAFSPHLHRHIIFIVKRLQSRLTGHHTHVVIKLESKSLAVPWTYDTVDLSGSFCAYFLETTTLKNDDFLEYCHSQRFHQVA